MRKEVIRGANPYMPLWEHVPDGEPRVFTHAGETRVYVYGSHDTERDRYCGRNYVVWSAPVDDGHISLIDAFFEASSPRKVMGQYVYIYSKRYEKPVPELGVYTPNNGFLSYRFSDSPFDPFHDGVDLIRQRVYM
ncbi:MAG: hypothetical protein IJT34_09340 [Butyrivibrio sp.]|nr:hypothetical protein [Butyrivibrio sp.]